MKIEITLEELLLLREALDALKNHDNDLIKMCEEVGLVETIPMFENDKTNIEKLHDKLTKMLYNKDE